MTCLHQGDALSPLTTGSTPHSYAMLSWPRVAFFPQLGTGFKLLKAYLKPRAFLFNYFLNLCHCPVLQLTELAGLSFRKDCVYEVAGAKGQRGRWKVIHYVPSFCSSLACKMDSLADV
jgi:hypothetical protein